MSDVLVPVGIQFQSNTLEQLNKITKAFENIQSKLSNFGGDLNQLSQSTQKVNSVTREWQQTVEKIKQSSGELVSSNRQLNNIGMQINETYKNQNGLMTKITTQLNGNLEVVRLNVNESKNLERIEKERTVALTQEANIRKKMVTDSQRESQKLVNDEVKAEKERTKVLTEEYNIRKKLDQIDRENSITVEKITGNFGTLEKTQNKISATGSTIINTYRNAQGVLTKITEQYDQNNRLVKTWENHSSKVHGLLDNITHSIGNAVSKMLLWISTGAILFGIVRGIKDAFKTMSEMEMAGVNIAKVLPDPKKLPQFEVNAIELAKQYGQSVLDVEKAMASWARRYKEVNDVTIMTKASLLAATATDIGFEESVTALSAIMSEWNMQTKESIHVVNMLNETSNNYKITASDLADALTKTGSGAKAVGLNIEELTGVVVTGIQSLGMAGDEVGTMWTRVMARMRSNKSAREAIAGLGIDAFAPLSDILDDLMVKWDTMTAGERQNFAITIAGTQHWSRFLAIMDNYNTVLEATAKSYFSVNSAQKEVDNVMATLQKHVGQLNASWQEYIYKNNAILGVQKGIVDTLRSIVAGLSKINPAIVGTILVLGGLTAAFFAIRNAYLSWQAAQIAAAGATAIANTTFRAFTATLLTNPFTAIITTLTVVTGLLLGFGSAAVSAEDSIMKIQIKQEELNQSIEDNQNIVRGIDDMSKKYEKLQQAIKNTAPGTQSNISLNQKLTTVQTELARALGMTNDEFMIQLNKDGSISTFARNRMEELIKQINLQRQLQWEMQQMMVMQGKAPELSGLMNFDQVNIAKKAVDDLVQMYKKYGTAIVTKQAIDLKSLAKGAGAKDLATQSMIVEILKSVNAASGPFGIGSNYSAENNKVIRDLENLYNYISLLNKNKPEMLTLQDLLKGSTPPGSTPPPDDTKPTINAIFTNLTEEQVKMIKEIGQAWEKNLNYPFKQDLNKYILQNGSQVQFNMSSEINNQLLEIFKPMGEISSGISKAVYDYNLKISEISHQKILNIEDVQKARTDVFETYQKYIQQLDESKFKLLELQKGLVPTSDEFQALAKAIGMIDAQKLKLLGESTKWQDITTTFVDMENKIKSSQDEYNRTMNELTQNGPPEYNKIIAAQTKLSDVYKKYIDDLDNNKKSLQDYLATLSKTDPLYESMVKSITGSINSLDEEKLKLLQQLANITPPPPPGNTVKGFGGSTLYSNKSQAIDIDTWNEERRKSLFSWTEVATNAINSFGDSLKLLGGTAAAAGELINTAISSIQKDQNGSINFGASWESFLMNIASQMLGALAGMLTPATHTSGNYKTDRQQNYITYDQMQSYRNFSGLQSKLDVAENQLHYWDSLSKLELGLNQNVNRQRDKWDKIVKDLRNSLQSAEEIRSAFGVAVDDMAGGLESAFSATNYQDFLSSWSRNLEDITRSSLIKAFMSSAEMNTFYQTLSNKIWNALSDQNVTGAEMQDIRSYSHTMDQSIKDFYNVLNGLGLNNSDNNNNNGGGSQDFVHGTSQPIVYNNYISLNAGAFSGDYSTAQTFLMWIREGLEDIESRA